MSRYIDADAICKELQGKNAMLDYAIYCINRQPTADVVEVVRCKDCLFSSRGDGERDCQLHKRFVTDNDYCSYGDVKE